MMRSGDGFESSYVSIESEIGFLWKGCVKIKYRQSGAAEPGNPKESASRDFIRHTLVRIQINFISVVIAAFRVGIRTISERHH